LHGLRVIDASRVLAGPFCGQILGDLGAEVLKIEKPGEGDETRGWGPPFVGELSAYFLSCNRNKRSLTLDLAHPQGAALFQDLVRRADVVLENFRPESAAKLGLTPDQLLGVNPRLIVCSISGFGRTGPLASSPGYDFAIQALSGLMSITGPAAGPPCKVGVAVTDVITGLYSAVAVLSCLSAREQSQHGYAIDLALLDCALAAQVNVAQAFLSSGHVPPRQGNAHLQIVPYQLFETADGWLVLAIGNDHQWQSFCEVAGRPDLASDARFRTNAGRVEHRTTLVPLVAELLHGASAAEWQDRLSAARIPHAPVWDYGELFKHPQIASRLMRTSVRDAQGRLVELLGSPFRIAGAEMPEPTMPPRLGEHSDVVLREWLNLEAEQVESLRKQGIV
jgi:crotonobetainyl-CoA:carnitine CoA-transferase CaiB-like acyl-CoA transferase